MELVKNPGSDVRVGRTISRPCYSVGPVPRTEIGVGGAGGPYRFHVHSLLPYAAGGVSSPITHILMRASLTLPRNSYSHAWPARSQVLLSPRPPPSSPPRAPGDSFLNRNLEWVCKHGWSPDKDLGTGVVDGRSVWADKDGERREGPTWADDRTVSGRQSPHIHSHFILPAGRVPRILGRRRCH